MCLVHCVPDGAVARKSYGFVECIDMETGDRNKRMGLWRDDLLSGVHLKQNRRNNRVADCGIRLSILPGDQVCDMNCHYSLVTVAQYYSVSRDKPNRESIEVTLCRSFHDLSVDVEC